MPGCGKGQRAVDEVAEVGKQLRVVLGRQVGPLEVGVGRLWSVAQQEVTPHLQRVTVSSTCMRPKRRAMGRCQ